MAFARGLLKLAFQRNQSFIPKPTILEAISTKTEQTPPEQFHLGYRRWLDGLRGLAILAVLGAHLDLFRGGFLGVDLFFVLSGFLITTLVVEEWQKAGSVSLKRFYLRRFLRLQPALFALILFGLVYTNHYRPAQAAAFRKESLVAATYIANWPNVHLTPTLALNHTWSLSVEEQFYLVWPILLYGMLRAGLSTRQVMWVAVAGALLSGLLRLLIYTLTLSESGIPSVQTINWLYLSSHMRADALLTGCAVGLFATSGLLPRARWVTLLLGLGALLSTATLGYMIWSADMMSPLLYQGLFSAVAAMVALILIRLLSVPSLVARWILGSTPLVILGRLSYSLYLVHVPVLLWVPHGLLGFYHMKNVVMMTGAIFAAALVLYFLVERPFLLLKKYVEKRSGTRFKIPKNGPVNPQLAAA